MAHPRGKVFDIIGGILVVLAAAVLLVSRFATGRLFWLNAWHQPVSVFLVLPVMAILAVIGLLNIFVWRKQKRGRKR